MLEPLFASTKETGQIRFRINQSAIDQDYRQNSLSLTQADSLLSLEGFQTVKIIASCSPDGPLAFNQYLSRARAEAVAEYLKEKHPQLSEGSYIIKVVEEDWEGLASFVRRSNQPWKEDALSIIKAGGENVKTLLQELWVGEAWEYMVKHYFQQLRTVKMEFSFADNETPAPTTSNATVKITYPRGIRHIYPGYGKNRDQLNVLETWINAGVDTLYIYTASTPDGSLAANEALSENRSKVMTEYLRELGYQGTLVSRCVGEDWDGVADLVGRMPEYQDLSTLLNDDSLDKTALKSQLRKIGGGASWRQLIATDAYKELRATYVAPMKKWE